MRTITRLAAVLMGLSMVGAATLAAEGAAGTGKTAFDIPAQELAKALSALADKTGLQVVYEAGLARGLKSHEVRGELSAREALEQLLEGTGLRFEFLGERAVAVAAVSGKRAAVRDGKEERVRVAEGEGTATGQAAVNEKLEEVQVGIPEILVQGSRALNMDIRRSRDGIQPYTVFHGEDIRNSGAVNPRPGSQRPTLGSHSSINLRGLGSDETLILVDGHRVAQFNQDGGPAQSDINGIPLSAIERVEVLPTTASGIYGGNATGGVINIVLRRDYTGLDTKLTYGNTFDSDAARRQIDLSGGFNFGGGRTSVLIAGSFADANPLLVRERDFVQRGRARILVNNPGFFFNATNPPLGATPNIRSNTVIGGIRQNLVLDNGTPLNSTVTFVPLGYAGSVSDAGAAFLANAGQYNLNLPNSAQQDGSLRGLLNNPRVKSLVATIRHDLTDRVQAFLDLQSSDTSSRFAYNDAIFNIVIPGSAANNPFQQSIRVSVPTVNIATEATSEYENRKATAGLIVKLPSNWRASLDYTWARARSSRIVPGAADPATRAAMASGSIDVLRDINRFPVTFASIDLPNSAALPGDAVLENPTLRFAGPLPWTLPGGPVDISTLVERREDSIGDTNLLSFGVPGTILVPHRVQSVDSVYLEAVLPLVSSANRVRGFEQLELQVAARRDDYRVEGASSFIFSSAPTPIDRFTNKNSSVDPTVGLRYQPIADVTFRTSYGTGYRPPTVSELSPNSAQSISLDGLTDPARNNLSLTGTVASVTDGGNPGLRPESSKSWSAGVILTPHWTSGLRLSVDWSWIAKTNNIGSLPLTQDGLNQYVAFFPERITRGPAPGGVGVGPITAIDTTSLNIARLIVKTVDLAADYQRQTGHFGHFAVSAAATHLLSSQTQATPLAPIAENAGVLGGPNSAGGVKWQVNAGIDWTFRALSLGWRTHFFDSYFVNLAHAVDASQGSATVPSQTYHDFFASYNFVPANIEVRLGVNNVFNKEPPVDVATATGLYYSPLGDPRLANYYLSFSKSFAIQ